MSSKKDYVAMAETIGGMVRELREVGAGHDADGRPMHDDPYTKGFIAGQRAALRVLAEYMCDTYRKDNLRFDRAKFMEACGFVV